MLIFSIYFWSLSVSGQYIIYAFTVRKRTAKTNKAFALIYSCVASGVGNNNKKIIYKSKSLSAN